MLRLSGNEWLRWGEEDQTGLARILGPDVASKLYTRALPSIVRAVVKLTKIRVHPHARDYLSIATRERGRLKSIREAPDVQPVPGYGTYTRLVDKLWAHQRVALHYMAKRPAYLLADRPGAGKTPVSILWTKARIILGRVLVVTTNKAKSQWAREIDRWGLGRAMITVVDGTIPEQAKQLRGDGWIVTHWESLAPTKKRRERVKALLAKPWDAVILDEAQAIRNRKAKRSLTAFALDASWRLALTGHPFFNSPDELYSILKFLYPEDYTSFWRFFSMHVNAVPKTFGGYEILGVRRPKLLRWEIAPFSLRRTKMDSLPPVTRIVSELELAPGARREYAKLKKQFFVELEAHAGAKRILAIPSVLARVTRLRQYLVDPGLLGAKQPSVKYPAVKELLEELDGPPVIFTDFKQAALRLRAFLGEKRIGLIAGGMTTKASDAVQAAFHAGELRALLVVTKAGSEALNLGRYGYVIFLDLPWTPAALEQAEGRVNRPMEGTGHVVHTTSYPLVVRDSYEGRLMNLLEAKRDMFAQVFTPAELEALFA